MDNKELKACPFCGKQPELKEWDNGHVQGLKIICHWCDYKRSFAAGTNKAGVLGDWNTRAEQPRPAVQDDAIDLLKRSDESDSSQWHNEVFEFLEALPPKAAKPEAAYNLTQADNLRDLVIILDDDAEPEIGDIVQFDKIAETTYGAMTYKGLLHNVSSPEILAKINSVAINIKIIQRQGKPFIYQSQLNKQEGGCE